MIITEKYARKLMQAGKARSVGTVIDGNKQYMTLIRTDIQRVDHYLYNTKHSVI